MTVKPNEEANFQSSQLEKKGPTETRGRWWK